MWAGSELEQFGWHEWALWARAPADPGTEVSVPKAGYRDYLLMRVRR